MVMPKKPASLSAVTLSQGYCSLRSTSAARGAITCCASSRACWFSACWLALNLGSIELPCIRPVAYTLAAVCRGGPLMYRDVRGLPLTAASQAAVDAYDATVGSYLRFGRDTGDLLKA